MRKSGSADPATVMPARATKTLLGDPSDSRRTASVRV
jgi:hypothetical protein